MTRHLSFVPACFCLALCCTAIPAGAQQDERRAEFRSRDRNHDGALTVQEYGGHPGNFRALDRDQDGTLSEEEFVFRDGSGTVGQPPVSPGDDFSRADRNHDRVLTRQEWLGNDLTWNRLDVDGNDRISREEWDNPLDPDSLEGRFASRDRNKDGWLARGEWVDEAYAFERMDRNRDGRVAMDEYRNPPALDPREQRFQQLDANHDGVISRSEWRGQPVSFHEVDGNADGAVTLREYMAVREHGGDQREGRFDELDRNDDGVLDRREWPRTESPFDGVDRNRDGAITLQEFLIFAGDQGELDFDRMDHDDDGVVSRREWHGDGATFDRLDRNHDGVITAWEFDNTAPVVPPRQDRFALADRNRDGSVSRREWRGDQDAFPAQDRNHDGVLSRYEFESTIALANRFRGLDWDGDGRLLRQEWRGDAGTFARLDRDRDGAVTRDEYCWP
jgi:Ca2+-binding EF-hand superfamily protein